MHSLLRTVKHVFKQADNFKYIHYANITVIQLAKKFLPSYKPQNLIIKICLLGPIASPFYPVQAITRYLSKIIFVASLTFKRAS
jgi:hypothetical protein